MTNLTMSMFLNKKDLEASKAKEKFDILVDRECVILDGKCDCPRIAGNTFPTCKKYDNRNTNP